MNLSMVLWWGESGDRGVGTEVGGQGHGDGNRRAELRPEEVNYG